MQSIQRCKKCGDLIWSSDVHDMVWCKCGAIAIDGGEDYCKVTGNLDDMEDVKPIDALNHLKDLVTRLSTEIEHANEQLKAKESVNLIYQNTLSLKRDDFKELVGELNKLKSQLKDAHKDKIEFAIDEFEELKRILYESHYKETDGKCYLEMEDFEAVVNCRIKELKEWL